MFCFLKQQKLQQKREKEKENNNSERTMPAEIKKQHCTLSKSTKLNDQQITFTNTFNQKSHKKTQSLFLMCQYTVTTVKTNVDCTSTWLKCKTTPEMEQTRNHKKLVPDKCYGYYDKKNCCKSLKQ